MKYLTNIFVIPFILLLTLIYHSFADNSIFWDYYYVITRDLSLSLLLFISINEIKNITLRGITFFASIHFFISAFAEFYLPAFWVSLISLCLIIAYGVIFRCLFVKRLKSDKYNERDNFIIIRKPKRIFELLRAYFFLDSIGSIKIVKSGRQIGFKIKKSGIEAVETKHTENYKYYIYIRTSKNIEIKNNKYNILFNNCLNCWNINVKNEINGRNG